MSEVNLKITNSPRKDCVIISDGKRSINFHKQMNVEFIVKTFDPRPNLFSNR